MKTRVAVLRGGPSSEYDISLKTGQAVLENLSQDRYIPQDVFIDRAGVWHVRGCPKEPRAILENTDVVLNAMHGEFGEDGTVQKILHRHGVPYTGSTAGPSALCLNKRATKRALEPYLDEINLSFAKGTVVDSSDDIDERLDQIYSELKKPIVVKPLVGGSSVGVSIVGDRSEFQKAIELAFKHCPSAFCEEYIRGKEATCGVLSNFRGENLYALLPIEIRPSEGHGFFDFAAKYEGASEEICPGNFTEKESKEIQQLARRIHDILGLRHYSRSDFILSPKGIYFLETNTLPGLTSESLVPKALQAVGCTFPHFLDHLVELALKR